MNQEEWRKHVEEELELIKSLMTAKQKEYAEKEKDVLVNFYKGAILQGISPEQALLGCVSKQIISIVDMIKKTNTCHSHNYARWQEKCHDIIVYQLLLLGLVKERGEENEHKTS